MTNKTLDTVRIYLQNAGGILPTEWGQLALDRMKMLTHMKQIDIFAMTETNADRLTPMAQYQRVVGMCSLDNNVQQEQKTQTRILRSSNSYLKQNSTQSNAIRG